MLLLLYPKLSINNRSIISNLSHHMRLGNNYNESFQFNDIMNFAYVITSKID